MGSSPPLRGPGLGASRRASAAPLSSQVHSDTGRPSTHRYPSGEDPPSLKRLAADKQGFSKGREKSRHIWQPTLQGDPGATPLASPA